jgi:hypothetical protein
LLFLREPSICKETPTAPPPSLRLDPSMKDQEWRASQCYQKVAFGRTIQSLLDKREELLRDDPTLKYMIELEFMVFEHAVGFRHEEERVAHLKHVRRLRRVAQLLVARGGDSALGNVLEAGFDTKKVLLSTQEEADVVKEIEAMLAEGKRENDVLLSFYMRARQICVDLRLAGEPPLPDGKLSTKMQLLVDDVKSRVGKEEKFIVFSEWVEVLKHAQDALERVGKVRVVMLHGRMSMQKRREALKQFKEDPKIRGICMQIDCGGLGLTITEANRIYQLEPLLNPQREKQGFGRIRRPGQTRNMAVTYLLIARSIEEIVRSTAARKLRLSERIQGRGDRAALSSLDVLRDVNLLLLSSSTDPAFRERDGELEYRQGLEQRRQYEVPPGFEATLTRAQIQNKARVFLGAFLAYNAVRTIPSSSILFRLSTRYRDLNARENRARQLEPLITVGVGAKKLGAKGEAPVDSIQMALDPLKLRRWLYEDFFKVFKNYEAERASRLATPFHDVYESSNYNELASLVETQLAKQGYASLDPVRANLPTDFVRVLQLVAKPLLTLHHTTEALITDRQAYGAYDARNASGDLVSVRGDAATRLRDSLLYPGAPVQLDVHVLVSYTPLWLDSVLSALLPLPSSAFGDSIVPGSLWLAPPALPELDRPPIESQIVNRSKAERDSLMRDVADFLLLAVAQAVRDQDASILTALLLTLLAVPVETDSIERRLFLCRSVATGSLLGIATAVIIRNPHVLPSRPVLAIVAPAVYVSLQFRESPEALRGIAGRLGRALVSSLFDDSTLSYDTSASASNKARLVSAQRGFVSFVEKSGDGGMRYRFSAAPSVANGLVTSSINWPTEAASCLDGFVTWTTSSAMEL